MPPFASLSDGEIADLVNFVRRYVGFGERKLVQEMSQTPANISIADGGQYRNRARRIVRLSLRKPLHDCSSFA